MKYRIFGTVIVLAILAVCYFITEQESSNQVQPVQQTDIGGLQPLKLN